MNYLAHFYFSHESAPAILGSILGDFVKGPIDSAAFCEKTRRSIRLHRAIDSFTDQHEIVIGSKNRLAKPYRRYAGILVDIYYDHFLAKHWDRYSDLSLEKFASDMYRVLNASQSGLPSRLQRMTPYMIEEDWLSSYREMDNIARALRGVSKRLRHDNPVSSGIVELENNYVDLERDFALFMHRLDEFVCDYKSQYDKSTEL